MNIKHLTIPNKENKAILTASKMLTTLFPISDVILFGSKARGDHDDESDIDLLLLTTEKVNKKLRNAILDALFDIELQYNVTISPLIINSNEWNQGPVSIMPIHKEVEIDGIAV
ncbi:nucleotidyltransferase domain-containing protein [Desulfonema limicola]|nr:nucleotidyltransferase domain-containing protein [Desulfonema limicola]